MPDDVPMLTRAAPEWQLIKRAVGGYADSGNYHSQCATSDGRRQMLWLVAQLHRLSAKLHEATGVAAAREVLELRAADTLAEAEAVQIAAE